MSTLTGNKISLTYKSLIKTADNDVLSGALKQLSDGLGNNSGVYLNTGGDLKSTGTLEFAYFKGTSTAVTINKLVNEADGISNNDNDTSLPTSAAVKDYVDTHVTTQDLDFSDGTNPGAVDLDSQVFAIVGTSNEIETSASGQQLQIGLPDDVTISGTYTGATFSGDLSGTINTATTATTQTAGDNSTKVATTAYVDTLDAASDLDFSGDSGTGDVNLNTQVLAVTGTANQIESTANAQGLSLGFPSQLIIPSNTTGTTQTAGDSSTKLATTQYVDTLDAASDLDITGDTGSGDVNLNTQSLNIIGTPNEVTTAVTGQTATIGLPSSISTNLVGNVTGDLTGNANTATAWQTARDLSLTSEATGTISSVDGSGNVSGAVTLLNSAVTAKVLTGLPTPAAGNIEPSDTILEAFGKVQSQINSISSGLVFKGSWDAATNTPNLTSGGGEVDSGTTDGATTAFKLIDSSQNFNTTVSVGNKVINQVDGQTALVTVIDSNTQLTLDADIMLTAEAYTIDASPFIQQGQYYVVNYAGTTNLNGITDWSIGDWVIADANNEWSKLDHSQIDGQGTTGNLPVFTTSNTIGDSIVSESGTALTVTGSLTTTLGLSSTGDFAVNTDKFTVAAVSGDTVIAGNLNFPDDKRIRLGDSNDFQIYYDSAAQAGQGEAIISDSHIRLSSTFFNLGTSAKTAIAADVNNYVRLYHGGNRKLQTISTGVDITGAINADSATFAGNVDIYQTGASQLQLESLNSDANIIINSGADGVGGANREEGFIRFYQDNDNHFTLGKRNNGQFVLLDHVAGSDVITVQDNGGILLTPANNLTTITGNVLLSGYLSVTSNNIGTGATRWIGSDGTTSTWFYNVPTGGNHYFAVNNSNQLSINSTSATFAGNVGIGITPNASYSKLQVKAPASSYGFDLIGRDAGSNSESQITFWNSNQTTQLAAIFNTTGNLGFVTGTTERMRIDSSGNVTIKAPTASGGGVLNLENTTTAVNGTDWGSLNFISNDSSTSASGIRASVVGTSTSFNGDGNLVFSTAPSNGTNTERMRIDSSGNVDLTSGGLLKGMSAIELKNNGSTDASATSPRLYSPASGTLAFSGNGSERMRITDAGDLTIGNFTPGNPSRLNVRGSGTYNTTFSRPGATVQIISDELTNDTWSPVLNITNVRQSLTTGKDSFGGIGFSSIDDSNNAGVFDAARIALVNEQPSSVTSPTSLAFYTNIATTQSFAATERMRIQADGNINITGGGRILSSAGIYLGTNNNNQLLDYYKEGTWTPAFVSGATASGTMTGKYTRIGRQVTVYGTGVYTAITGNIVMSGLPFTNGSMRAATVTALIPVGGASTQNGYVDENATTFSINITGTYSGGGISFYFGATYFV